jgi:hypothetical protein
MNEVANEVRVAASSDEINGGDSRPAMAYVNSVEDEVIEEEVDVVEIDDASCGFKLRRLASCGINTLRFVAELLMTAISPEFRIIRIQASAESRISKKQAPPIGL